MDTSVERQGDVCVITVTGDLDGDQGYALFLTASDQAHDGARTVVLDLAGVTFIDSIGLGMLVRCRDELGADPGTAIVLRHPSDRVARMLELTALTEHFAVEN